VYGRTVDYTWVDDGGQPESNLAAAQQLVAGHGIFAVQEFSLAPKGSAALFNRVGMPVVGTSDDLVWNQYPNMFSSLNFVSDGAGSVSTWGDYALSQGVKKAAVLYSRLSAGTQIIAAKYRVSLEAAKIPTKMIAAESAGLDVAAVVRQIRASGADLLTGAVDATSFFRIAVAARSVLPGIKIMTASGYDQGILALGKQLAGMGVFIGTVPFERFVPAHKIFLDAIAQYAPQLQPSANAIALTGWVDTDLLLRGLQAAGPCPTRRSFTPNLRAVTDYDAGGLLAASVNMRTIRDQPTSCYWFLQIGPAGDRFIPVGNRPLCGHQLQ
jgi:branched-chain amino acid transport system substrate-binding protein